MENTTAWVDVYLEKLFAGENVTIEEVFYEMNESERVTLNYTKKEDTKEQFLH